MKLVRFALSSGSEMRPGVVVGDTVYDLSEEFDSLSAFIAAFPEGWGNDAVKVSGLRAQPLSSVRLGPPVAPDSTLFAVGANYKKHAEEAGLDVPPQPVVFTKIPTSLVGPYDPIELPPLSQEMDYEGELAAVIGRTARRVSAAEAMRHVAGYTIVNDVSARDLQWTELGKYRIVDWFSCKCLDNSTPVGPWVVSAKQIPDPMALHIKTQLNGTMMQDSGTSLMVFGIPQLIEFISARATLRPGDVISTGTPVGVGGFRKIFLKEGDRLRVEIPGIGAIDNPVKPA